MLARLWWKEIRTLGLSLPVLWLAAAGVQALLIFGGDEPIPSGTLAPIALIWALLYGFAAGAAAFAGERESRTLGFLDALPVGRGVLWLGKSTFALVSTFALALALVGLAATGTEVGDAAQSPYGYGHERIAREFGILLLEAVAWSLLWSSILANPLAAAALGVASVGAVMVGSNIMNERNSIQGPDLVDPDALTLRLVLASAALLASALILIRPKLPRRPVVARVAPGLPPMMPARASAGRSLDWQARREGQGTWLVALGIGILASLNGGLMGLNGPDVATSLLLTCLACLGAGVSVFGPEGASGSRRFLLHQGVGPGQAWGHKFWIWGLAMLAFGGIVYSANVLLAPEPLSYGYSPTRPDDPGWVVASVLLDAFALGVLSGMAIRRRITAMLMATVALVAIAPLQVGLQQQGMIPAWSLMITPAILIAVSRAWAGDWLADRGGARPWVKLGLLLAIPTVLASAGYVGYRAFGVADVAPAPPVPAPVGDDLTDRYRRIIAEIHPTPGPSVADETIFRVVRGELGTPRPDAGKEPDSIRDSILAWRDLNAPAVDKARKAAAEPRGWVAFSTRDDAGPLLEGINRLSSLFALEAQHRRAGGDLAGAWEDIIALYRLGEQVDAGPPSIIQSIRVSVLRRAAADLAFDWANDRRQGLATLRKAREDLNRLAPPAPAVAAFRAESQQMDRMFDLPAAELGRMFLPARTTILIRVGFNLIVASPWERRRAKNVARAFLAEQADLAAGEPWRRPRRPLRSVTDPQVMRASPLAWRMMAGTDNVQDLADRQVEARRALEQVLAIRSWQLAHEGKMPATLEELVPGELPRLPIDPYSGRTYGYVAQSGQELPKRRSDDPVQGLDLVKTVPGQYLLYSVGPDATDNRAANAYDRQSGRGDFIYPIP